MERILFSDAVQAADQAAVERGIPSLVLMERAALSVVHFLDHHRGRYDVKHVLAVCGPGNNGGDGAAIVRILRERGLEAKVLLIGDDSRLSMQMRQQLAILEALPGESVIRAGDCTDGELDSLFGQATLFADALFGIGLRREVTGTFADMIGRMNQSPAPVIAVDMPSGIHTDTGEVCGTAVRADATVTFTCAKPGLYLYPGASYAGEIHIRPVGIAMPPERDFHRELGRLTDEDLAGLKERDESGNKGTFGKLLVIAGNEEISGAAYLCACAALRAGAGMVRIYTEERNRQILGTLLPEALFTTYRTGSWSPDGLIRAMEWADGAIAGPGLGTGETSSRILKTFLETNRKPAVLDADALNLLSDMQRVPAIKYPCVMTPHVGEMSRLTGISPEDIKAHLVSIAANVSAESGAAVLLKDARSAISCPDGSCWINTSGNSALSTAGSGDVLAGLAGALLLREKTLPYPAAVIAAYIHGRCGELAALKRSRASVIASDLTEEFCHFL